MTVGYAMTAAAVAGWLTLAIAEEKSGRSKSGKSKAASLVENCQNNNDNASQTVDRLIADLQEAKKDGNAAKNKQFLEKAEVSLNNIKDHLNQCAQDLNRMQGQGRREIPAP